MQIPENKFKRALQDGKQQYGIFMAIPNTTVAELCAGAGFDWVLLDGEHGTFDLQSTMTNLQVLAAYPVSSIVRVVEGQTAVIKQVLDIGVQTILVPMIDTPEQAEQVVRACNYPTAGIRGVAAALVRASQWNRISDYLHKANDEICVIVQAETVTAIENIEAIAAVEGVDAVFIGPADLSASMGYIGQPNHPEVIEAVSNGIKRIRSTGKQAGVMAVTKDLVEKYTEAGASFVGVGVDAALISSATRNLAAEYVEETKNTDIAGY